MDLAGQLAGRLLQLSGRREAEEAFIHRMAGDDVRLFGHGLRFAFITLQCAQRLSGRRRHAAFGRFRDRFRRVERFHRAGHRFLVLSTGRAVKTGGGAGDAKADVISLIIQRHINKRIRWVGVFEPAVDAVRRRQDGVFVAQQTLRLILRQQVLLCSG